jgi:hypothetical protein
MKFVTKNLIVANRIARQKLLISRTIIFKLGESQKLQYILTDIYSKVRSLQINNNFDMAVEREAKKTYIGMPDNYFFPTAMRFDTTSTRIMRVGFEE